MDESDREKVNKLHLFFHGVENYAQVNHIYPKPCDFGGFYKIRFNKIDFEIGMLAEPSIYEYDNVFLFELEKQFNISNKTFNIMLDPGIGDRVGICRGIHFFFHTNEKDIHHVPHIHCKCGNEEFRVNLNSLEILDKRFKSRKRMKLAIEIIKANQEELIKYWNNVVINGEKVKFKMYLPHL